MKFLSVCSGIEAASLAWTPLGWECAAFSEIDKFACALLAHRYPNVPNLGDMTRFKEWPNVGPVDLLVGGTPCQAFSVAGLRKGLADARGNLALVFLGVLDRLRPEWVVWENVDGVLSSLSHDAPDPVPPSPPVDLGCDGQEVETEDDYASEELHAFNCFLAGLSELGYGWAYRVLDAQHFGVPQRRNRVFVVGHLGDWRRAAAVLLERHCLSGDLAPRREARESPAPVSASGAGGANSAGVGRDGDPSFSLDTTGSMAVAGTLNANGKAAGSATQQDAESGMLVSGQCHGTNVGEMGTLRKGNGNVTGGVPFVAMARNAKAGTHLDAESETLIISDSASRIAHSLKAEGSDASEDGTGRGVPLVFDERNVTSKTNRTRVEPGRESHTLHASPPTVAFTSKDHGADAGEIAPTLRSGEFDTSHANGGVAPAVAFQESQSGTREYADSGSLRANGPGHDPVGTRIREGMQVRRLTPTECERLMGMPDDWTLIPYHGKPAADGPRYRALGNSIVMPVLRWIGERIAIVDGLPQS